MNKNEKFYKKIEKKLLTKKNLNCYIEIRKKKKKK